MADPLEPELLNDATTGLNRGYAGMDQNEIWDSIHVVDRERNREDMTGSEVLQAVDPVEWGTRSADQKQSVWDVVHLGTVNPFGVEATLITAAFTGAGGVTIGALADVRKEAIHRATEIGWSGDLSAVRNAMHNTGVGTIV